jgi:hypothetical protein
VRKYVCMESEQPEIKRLKKKGFKASWSLFTKKDKKLPHKRSSHSDVDKGGTSKEIKELSNRGRVKTLGSVDFKDDVKRSEGEQSRSKTFTSKSSKEDLNDLDVHSSSNKKYYSMSVYESKVCSCNINFIVFSFENLQFYLYNR